MKIISYYDLNLTGFQYIPCYNKAKPLAVQVRGGGISLWVECDLTQVPRGFEVQMVGTGQTVPDDIGIYIDTIQYKGFTWHIYVKEEEDERV